MVQMYLRPQSIAKDYKQLESFVFGCCNETRNKFLKKGGIIDSIYHLSYRPLFAIIGYNHISLEYPVYPFKIGTK